jgi:hypothetical protein
VTQIIDVSPTRANTTLTEGSDYQSASGRMLSMGVGTDGRVYVGSYANVFRSDDSGKTFTQCIRPQPPPGQFDVASALDGNEVFDLAVSPADSNLIVAITRYDLRATPRHGIYRSTDGGASWALVHQFPGLPTQAGQVIWPRDDPRTIFAAWGSSVAISRDSGATFTDTMPWGSQSGAAFHVAVGLALASVGPLYALGNSRIWVSLDRGITWTADAGPIPAPSGGATGEANTDAPSVLVSPPGQPRTVFLVTSPGNGIAQLWRGSYDTFETTGMSSWTQVPLPEYDTDSGNRFVAAPVPGVVYFCGRSRLFVAPVDVSDESGWRSLDDDTDVHVDLHGVFFSADFDAAFVDGEYRRRAGTMWLLSDGGVDRSDDGGYTFHAVELLTTLGAVNISGVAQEGATALCINTGDNSSFYSLDAGGEWKTQQYLGGDNDCSYADPLQPDRMLMFTPRNGGDNRSVTVYVNPNGGLPDARKGTSQGREVPGPPAAHNSDLPPMGFDMPNWNAISGFGLRGFRPIVLTRRGEEPLDDGDYIFIRYKTDVTAVLLRTHAIRSIDSDDEWDTVATRPDQGNVFQQGPPLPAADVRVVQASGGHTNTVFYVGVDANRRLWKWTEGMAGWKQLVPTSFLPTPVPIAPQSAIRFFVDPYRPDILFVVDAVHVWRSDNGGATWVIDTDLERQATNDGAIPTSLDPSDGTPLMDVVLQDMQFDPDDGRTRFAVGVAGAFFTADGIRWNRLLDSAAFPGRATSCYYDGVSDPCQRALYVGFAGRGIVKLAPLPWGSLQAPDPAAWSPNVTIPDQKSKAAVALAVFRDVIHMVHLGDSSNDIWWSTSTDGVNWTPNVRIPNQRSKATPALAVYNDRLHMVHLGNTSNDIWWSIFDGTSWNKSDGTPGNQRIPDQKSKAAPALAAFGGRLHMVHLGDTSNDIWWSMFDGTSWKQGDGATDGNTKIKGQRSKVSPALAAFGTRLHMVHLGESSNDIWWSSFDGDDWWSNTRIRCQKSKASPALAPFGGALHMVHLGDSSNRLWWSIYDGSEWTPNVVIPDQKSKATPALVATPGGAQLLMVHLGDSSNNLWRSLA